MEADTSFRSGTGVDLKFGWVAGKEDSVFVSALVYNVLGKNTAADHQSVYQWIVNTQKTDGSFGNGLADTAAALLWLEMPDTPTSDAIDYLVDQQQPNGSWNDDPYLTGLCAEALARIAD